MERVTCQVELQIAERREARRVESLWGLEARLAEVVVLILDQYLTQRDIWHLHAAMLQDGGQLLYANFDYPQGAPWCGRVTLLISSCWFELGLTDVSALRKLALFRYG